MEVILYRNKRVTKILMDKQLATEQGILDYMRREAAAGGAQ